MARAPVLDIPTSPDVNHLQAAFARLRFDDPRETTDSRGETQYMYSVNDEAGVEKRVFARPRQHEKIQKTGARKGDILALARVGQGTETKWFAWVANDHPMGAAAAPAGVASASSAPRRPSRPYAEEEARYFECFDRAVTVVRERWPDVQIHIEANAMAYTLKRMLDEAPEGSGPAAGSDGVPAGASPSLPEANLTANEGVQLNRALDAFGLNDAQKVMLAEAVTGRAVREWSALTRGEGAKVHAAAKALSEGDAAPPEFGISMQDWASA